MDSHAPSYRGDRFPPDIIRHAVWLYHRVRMSFRDVEDLPGGSLPVWYFVNVTVPV